MKKRVISKDYLLEVAHAIASEEGPEGLNIRSVASRANVSIGSVYNYFESKEAIIEGLITKIWNLHYNEIVSKYENITSYTAFLSSAYHSLHHLTQDMYSIFDFHIRNSSDVQKAQAFEAHHHQVKMLKDLFMTMMRKDTKVKASIWTDTFTEESFNLFVVRNYFSAIKRRDENVDFLVELVSKIIY